jgi:hypothetical protein
MIDIPIQIVSDEEAEQADFVVCMPLGPSPFADNVTAKCCDCEQAIMHRPHVPKRPPKICITCAADRGTGGRA